MIRNRTSRTVFPPPPLRAIGNLRKAPHSLTPFMASLFSPSLSLPTALFINLVSNLIPPTTCMNEWKEISENENGRSPLPRLVARTEQSSRLRTTRFLDSFLSIAHRRKLKEYNNKVTQLGDDHGIKTMDVHMKRTWLKPT